MGGHDYLCRRMSNLEAETLSKQATPSKKDDSTDLRVLPVLFDAAEAVSYTHLTLPTKLEV